MPAAVFGSSSSCDITITVQYAAGLNNPNGGGCGKMSFNSPNVNGLYTGGTITMYQFAQDDEYPYGTYECTGNTLAESIGHEIGHAFQLADNGTDACRGHIMGRHLPSGADRTIGGDDCSEAGSAFKTDAEFEHERQQNCLSQCQGSCYNGHCDADECFQYPDGSYSNNCLTDPRYGGSPILIDLDVNGFHLTDRLDGVVFDLNGDGMPERNAWTREDEADGFLALDRNNNGIIDNGSELFGNFTRLSNGSQASNGYIALAEFDRPEFGGTPDGFINSGDAIWTELRVWVDVNHNGVSESEELLTLDTAGVISVATDYNESRRHDRFGNSFRYRAKAWVAVNDEAMRETVTYDVFFVSSQPGPHRD